MTILLVASREQRTFWLLVGLALALLLNVSFTAVEAASGSLLQALRRDLAALQVQIERLEPLPARAEAGTATATDLGDGGQVFLWDAGEQMVRRTKRHVHRLQALARAEASMRAQAQSLWSALHGLEGHLQALRRAAGPAAAEAHREAALTSLEAMQDLLPSLNPWLESVPAREARLGPGAAGPAPEPARAS